MKYLPTDKPSAAAGPVERWLGSLGMVLLLWVFLLYADTFLQGAPPAADADKALPRISIAAQPSQRLRPEPDQALWGRFPSDCWLQAIVGGELVLDRFFRAGDRLDYSGELPDQLVLGSASAEIWLFGTRLTERDGEARETAILYRIKNLAAQRGRGQAL